METEPTTALLKNIMVDFPANIRMATTEDALSLAQLINMAGEGLPEYFWSSMKEHDDESIWDVGQRRALRESGGFSYRNSVVRVNNGQVAATLIGYKLPDRPEKVDYESLPPMFVPLQQLEDLVPGTWYVNVLATYPDSRGKGYGTELLHVAEDIARSTDATGISIMVSDANDGARRLYQRNGYNEIAKRDMVKEEWKNDGKKWILLTKNLR